MLDDPPKLQDGFKKFLNSFSNYHFTCRALTFAGRLREEFRMKPRIRVAKLLDGCDPELKLSDSQDLLERLVIEAENDALLLASIELENNYFPRFTQAEAAHAIRKLMRHEP